VAEQLAEALQEISQLRKKLAESTQPLESRRELEDEANFRLAAAKPHLLQQLAGKRQDHVPKLRRDVALHSKEQLGSNWLLVTPAKLRQLQRGRRLGRYGTSRKKEPAINCSSGRRTAVDGNW